MGHLQVVLEAASGVMSLAAAAEVGRRRIRGRGRRRVGGGGGGMGRVVVVEIILRLPHVLPELLLLEIGVVSGGADQVCGGGSDLGPVDLVGLVAEGGFGCAGHHFGAGEELGGFRMRLVALRMIRVHG